MRANGACRAAVAARVNSYLRSRIRGRAYVYARPCAYSDANADGDSSASARRVLYGD